MQVRQNEVTALEVADEDFLVASLIERCPKTMMIRELMMNAIEAARLAPESKRRIEISAEQVDGTAKLAIWNTGPGMDAAELLLVSNIASSIGKEKSLTGNFGMGAKVASLPSRSIRLGWVVDFDDENKQFLILFGERAPDYQAAASQETAFALTGGSTSRKTTAKARPGQQRFRFQVLAKYGCKCSVCTITHPSLMKAAHICGKAHNGSDDWRNGLPLCSTHHDAFDAHLFTINPETLAIETMPSVSPASIGITTKSLTPIHQHPHPEALSWRFTQTNRLWAAQDNLIAAPRQ